VMVGVDDTLHAPPFALPATKPSRLLRPGSRKLKSSLRSQRRTFLPRAFCIRLMR
jgi:hypothetical protein